MTSPAPTDCWFCRTDRGSEAPPGGWLHDHGPWRAWHALPGWGPEGTVIIETVEHVEDFAALDPEAATSLTALVGRLQYCICAATDADRAYVWATMDAWPHLHLWLVPWSHRSPSRGPRHLADVLGGDRGCDAQAALRAANTIRGHLERDWPSPSGS